MVEKVVYLLFTIETEEEISDRQVQIVCLRGLQRKKNEAYCGI